MHTAVVDGSFASGPGEWGIPCSSRAGGVGSIPANADAQNVPSFRRWRFEMKLSPFFYWYTILDLSRFIELDASLG